MKNFQLRLLSGFLGFAVMRFAAGLCLATLIGMLVVVFVNALPAMSWAFLTDVPRNMMSEGGIWPCIVGTFLLAAGALMIALPLGVASAVYLNEYRSESAAMTVVRLSIANLAGVLTLAALKQIPQDWREASLALGATRRETIMKVLLPNALPGILTGAILALARAAGETAAIMNTGAVFFTPKNDVSLFEPVMALPYHVYVMATSGTNIEATRPLQYGTALVLVVLVFVMSLAPIIIRERRRAR